VELLSIEIRNYRSIETVEIDTRTRCRIFLGINESGKTSILDAVHALSPDFQFDFAADAKIPSSGEYEFQEPEIAYAFAFSLEEKKSLLRTALGDDHRLWPITLEGRKLDEFCEGLIGEHELVVTLKNDGSKDISATYDIRDELLQPRKDTYLAETGLTVTIKDKDVTFEEDEWCRFDPEQVDNWSAVETHFVAASPECVEETIANTTTEYLKANPPNVIHWHYDDALLLSDPVPVDGFASRPESCQPLRNMFHLAGITDIAERIERDKENDSAFINLLKTVSDAATKHVHRVWRDYKDIRIHVAERSGRLSVMVQDKRNLYNFRQRSDGFKRFISFLLLLSAEHKTDSLPTESIILMDEPDGGLHPSGTKHLLNEILAIAKHNCCLVATHSPFLIDRQNIERHYIVKRESENTTIEAATRQNFAEEEVLFNALGTSLFDILKPHNLLFEGWTDKEVFKTLIDRYGDALGDGHLLAEIGLCWSSSASKICQTVRPLLWAGDRFFLVVADHDTAGLDERKRFDAEFSSEPSIFKTYRELASRRASNVTLEDLLPKEVVAGVLTKHLMTVKPDASPSFSTAKLKSGGVLHAWQGFVAKHHADKKHDLLKGYKRQLPDALRQFIAGWSGSQGELDEQLKPLRQCLEGTLKVIKEQVA